MSLFDFGMVITHDSRVAGAHVRRKDLKVFLFDGAAHAVPDYKIKLMSWQIINSLGVIQEYLHPDTSSLFVGLLYDRIYIYVDYLSCFDM